MSPDRLLDRTVPLTASVVVAVGVDRLTLVCQDVSFWEDGSGGFREGTIHRVEIPQLQGAVRDIAMKLSEMERSNASRLMKIKDIVRAK